jgi:predicted AlkP superfamily phosphohydrolase/phosphomutase
MLWGTGLCKFIPESKGITWHSAIKSDLVDFKKTKAFSPLQGFIFINHEGEEKGCVKKEDYQKIRTEIVNKLKDLKVEDIKLVVKEKEQVFRGKYINNAPDIIIYDENFRYWPVTIVDSPDLILKIDEKSPRSGHHHIDGIIISNQKILNLSEKKEIKIQKIHDIVLHMFKDKIKNTEEKENSELLVPKNSELEGEEEVMKRLESLGYLT